MSPSTIPPLLPQQHQRAGHKPLLPVFGVAEGGVGQQVIEVFGDGFQVIGGEADGDVVPIAKLEVEGTVAQELKAEGQLLSDHRVDPYNLFGVEVQEDHQAAVGDIPVADQVKAEAQPEHSADQPEYRQDDALGKKSIDEDQPQQQQGQRTAHLEPVLPPEPAQDTLHCRMLIGLFCPHLFLMQQFVVCIVI